DQLAGVVAALLRLVQQALAGAGIKLNVARQQPEKLPIRAADQGDTVFLVQIKHPVMALGQLGKERAEPVVEAYPEPVGAAGLSRRGFTSGLLALAITGFATGEHPDIAVGQQTVAGFGAAAVSLKEHRQPCLLVPDALIALQIDMADGGRRVVAVFGSGT